MTDVLAAHAAAFALGAAHALEVDHMVAVSAFIGGRPRLAAAVSFGLRWGLGHAVVVVAAGTVLAWSGAQLPASWTRWAALLVGVTLVALGAWAFRAASRLHLHDPAHHAGHAHLHAHPPEQHPHHHHHGEPATRHRHLSTLVGAAHGLAGTAPVVALIPVTLLESRWAAATYLVAFGLGTMLAMGAYAALAALALQRSGVILRSARGLARLTAVVSAAVGVWWIVRVV